MADRTQLPTDDRPPADEGVPVEEGAPADEVLAVDDPAPPRPARRDGGAALARARRQLIAVGAVAVLSLVVAGWAVLDARELRAAEAQRTAALEAGELVAVRVTTFEGATIDEWVADTRSLATEGYAQEVTTLFDQDFRQALAENQVASVGEILSSFVQDLDDDEATVFAVVRQTYTSSAQPRPIADELRMEISLVHQDGEWLADEVAVLGPSTFAPPEAGAEAAPGAEGGS